MLVLLQLISHNRIQFLRLGWSVAGSCTQEHFTPTGPLTKYSRVKASRTLKFNPDTGADIYVYISVFGVIQYNICSIRIYSVPIGIQLGFSWPFGRVVYGTVVWLQCGGWRSVSGLHCASRCSHTPFTALPPIGHDQILYFISYGIIYLSTYLTLNIINKSSNLLYAYNCRVQFSVMSLWLWNALRYPSSLRGVLTISRPSDRKHLSSGLKSFVTVLLHHHHQQQPLFFFVALIIIITTTISSPPSLDLVIDLVILLLLLLLLFLSYIYLTHKHSCTNYLEQLGVV